MNWPLRLLDFLLHLTDSDPFSDLTKLVHDDADWKQMPDTRNSALGWTVWLSGRNHPRRMSGRLSLGQWCHLAVCGGMPLCQEGAAGCRTHKHGIDCLGFFQCTDVLLFIALRHVIIVKPLSKSKVLRKA